MTVLKLTLAASLAFGLLHAAALAEDWSIKGQPPPGWHGEREIKTPESSVPKPGDAGKREHTNTKIYVPVFPKQPNNQPGNGGSGEAPPSETPKSR